MLMNLPEQLPMLGDPVLDREHHDFAQLVSALADSTQADAATKLDALRALATSHFAHEDAELARVGGPNAQCHLDEHAAVLQSLGQVRAMIETTPDMLLCHRLVAELQRWLPEHVQAMDAGLATSLTQTRLGGAPLVLHRRQPAQD